MEGETEDISKLTEVQEEEPAREEVVDYSPDPDVRLVRNIWTRGNVEERVKNVKFMCGVYLRVMNYYLKGLAWGVR